jgi:hypothetical protein
MAICGRNRYGRLLARIGHVLMSRRTVKNDPQRSALAYSQVPETAIDEMNETITTR